MSLTNFLVFLSGLVTLWQEKIATKAQKHKDFTKKKQSKILNLTALPVRDGMVSSIQFSTYIKSLTGFNIVVYAINIIIRRDLRT
jgi:hypothetical protein